MVALFVTEYMLFFLLFILQCVAILHWHFRWCSSICWSSHSDLADVGLYDSDSGSSDYHFPSFSTDIGAAGQCGWMDRWPCFLVPPEGLLGGHSQHRWHHSLARTTAAATVSVGRGLPPGRFKLSTDHHWPPIMKYYVDASQLLVFFSTFLPLAVLA